MLEHYEILGVGSPIVDFIRHVDTAYVLQTTPFPGGMYAVSQEHLQSLLEEAPHALSIHPGGSSANTLRGLAHLGLKCAFIGKVGSDWAGDYATEQFLENFVAPLLIRSPIPTAQVLSLVTPDKERSMCTFLGAGIALQPDELSEAFFKNIKLLHLEGYLFANPSLIERAADYAKKTGALISIDLASYHIVDTYRNEIIYFLKNYAHIVFANALEIEALLELRPKAACEVLKTWCEVAVVLMGGQGCWAGQRNSLVQVPAFQVPVVDTTGAGDLFASGFLTAFLKGKPLAECALWGCKVAASVIQIEGANLPSHFWKILQDDLFFA